MSKIFLIVIVGPTAVGKTSVSIELAKSFKSEVISADSRQFFKELEIGTAKPTEEELKSVPHHFINTHSIYQPYDVGEYERDVLQFLDNRFNSIGTLFLVGGSGLYVNAVCNGIDNSPPLDEVLRKNLIDQYSNKGLQPLVEKLKEVDPVYFEFVDKKNPQRIIRALEVSLGTGQPYSTFRKSNSLQRPFEIIKVGLELDRIVLYERINLRMDQMIGDGLFEEAERFKEVEHLNALQTVGYKEIFGYLKGAYSKDEAVRLLKRNSRRYAKRQLTWFKKDKETKWFNPNELDQIKEYINSEISKSLKSKE